MRKKKLVVIVAGVVLAVILGACGVEETIGSADKTEIMQTESKENAEFQLEDETQNLTLEIKHVYYTSTGEFQYSYETKYDTLGNPIWNKIVQDRGMRSSLAVGEQLQQELQETEYTYE